MESNIRRIWATLLCLSLFLTAIPFGAAAASEEAVTAATNLNDLSLFQGNGADQYALDREVSRIEAAVMLVRLAGLEADVKSATCGTVSYSYEDVPGWASLYLESVYTNQLMEGLSDTEFGTGPIGYAEYLSLVLGLMGYEAEGAFNPEQPDFYAAGLGLFPGNDPSGAFLRADMVLLTWRALFVECKNQGMTLGESLITKGAFTQEQYDGLFEAAPTLMLEGPSLPLGRERFSYTVTNQTKHTVETIQSYSLERQVNEGWVPVPLDLAFTQEMLILSPGGSYQFTAWLSPEAYAYEPGTYRICKTVFVENEALTLTAEFTLV